jgi:hypothetical protein
MGKDGSEEMVARRRQQADRTKMATIGSGSDKVDGHVGVELVDLEKAVENLEIPFEEVHEDMFPLLVHVVEEGAFARSRLARKYLYHRRSPASWSA